MFMQLAQFKKNVKVDIDKRRKCTNLRTATICEFLYYLVEIGLTRCQIYKKGSMGT